MLQSAREVARRKDDESRREADDADRIVSLFRLGFEMDERIDERLKDLKGSSRAPTQALPGLEIINLDHSRGLQGRAPASALVIFTSVSDLVFGGWSGRVARCRSGGRRFHGPGGCSGRGRRARCGQAGGGSAKMARKQASSSRAQGQVSGILILRLRWPRTSRAAVCSSR